MDKQPSSQHGEHLEALLKSSPDAIIAINAEGTIKFANKEACKLTEREMNELIGESIVEIYETLEAAKETNRRLHQGGGTVHDHESRIRTKTGKIVPVRISASHLKDSNGKYIGGIGYFARYRPWGGAEAEVKARVDELEAKLDKWKTLATPVFELYPGLSVMVVTGHLDVERFEAITQNLLKHIESVKTKVALLDLSAAAVDDNEVANRLARTIRTVRLLGADCIIAGMQTALARAMEPLMAELGSVKSFGSMELALKEALRTIGYEIQEKG